MNRTAERMNGDYEAPILREPDGGPIPDWAPPPEQEPPREPLADDDGRTDG